MTAAEKFRNVFSQKRLLENANRIDFHSANPGESFKQYVQRRKAGLAFSLKGITKVYLDTKFWLILRDISNGTRNLAKELRFSKLLSQKVKENRVVCPVSMDVFMEVMKQTDPSSRTKTFGQVQEFSKSISIENYFDLKALEIQNYFENIRKNAGATEVIENKIWTKLPYTMGLFENATPTNQREAINKAFFDLMWDITPAEMNELLPDSWADEGGNSDELANIFNEAKTKDHDYRDTFESSYLKFVKHDIDVLGSQLSLFVELLRNSFGYKGNINRDEFNKFVNFIQNTLWQAISSNIVTVELPCITVLCGIHSAIRHQRERKYKPNDFHDIGHATYAIPYFDCFFTEKSLRHLITTKPLNYDKAYKTKIADDVITASAILENL